MYQLKKIDLGTVAIYSLIMLFIISFLFTLPFGLMFSVISKLIPQNEPELSGIFPMFGVLFIFILPIFYSVVGTAINVLIALCYNLLSIKLGGIKFDLKKLGNVEQLDI